MGNCSCLRFGKVVTQALVEVLQSSNVDLLAVSHLLRPEVLLIYLRAVSCKSRMLSANSNVLNDIRKAIVRAGPSPMNNILLIDYANQIGHQRTFNGDGTQASCVTVKTIQDQLILFKNLIDGLTNFFPSWYLVLLLDYPYISPELDKAVEAMSSTRILMLKSCPGTKSADSTADHLAGVAIHFLHDEVHRTTEGTVHFHFLSFDKEYYNDLGRLWNWEINQNKLVIYRHNSANAFMDFYHNGIPPPVQSGKKKSMEPYAMLPIHEARSLAEMSQIIDHCRSATEHNVIILDESQMMGKGKEAFDKFWEAFLATSVFGHFLIIFIGSTRDLSRAPPTQANVFSVLVASDNSVGFCTLILHELLKVRDTNNYPIKRNFYVISDKRYYDRVTHIWNNVLDRVRFKFILCKSLHNFCTAELPKFCDHATLLMNNLIPTMSHNDDGFQRNSYKCSIMCYVKDELIQVYWDALKLVWCESYCTATTCFPRHKQKEGQQRLQIYLRDTSNATICDTMLRLPPVIQVDRSLKWSVKAVTNSSEYRPYWLFGDLNITNGIVYYVCLYHDKLRVVESMRIRTSDGKWKKSTRTMDSSDTPNYFRWCPPPPPPMSVGAWITVMSKRDRRNRRYHYNA